MKTILFGAFMFLAGLLCHRAFEEKAKEQIKIYSDAEKEIMETIDCIERNK